MVGPPWGPIWGPAPPPRQRAGAGRGAGWGEGVGLCGRGTKSIDCSHGAVRPRGPNMGPLGGAKKSKNTKKSKWEGEKIE